MVLNAIYIQSSPEFAAKLLVILEWFWQKILPDIWEPLKPLQHLESGHVLASGQQA